MKTKNLFITLLLIAISIFLASCTSRSSREKFEVTSSYTQVVGNYGYLRVDSILRSRFCILDNDGVSVKTNVFRRNTRYRVNHSTTFLFLKLSEAKESCTLESYEKIKGLGVMDTINIQNVFYCTKWDSKYIYGFSNISKLAYKVASDKISNPYTKVLDGYICFRPYIKDAIIVREGETDISKSLANSNGSFQDVEGNYPYYFYKGDESLLILDKETLNCVDTIPGVYVESSCDDNSRFLFLCRNDNTGYYIYDIDNLKIVTDKRDNNKANILLENELVNTYTGFTNEKEFEGTNLLKVTFNNNGKTVVSLLNETTMTHASEILYEDIKGFDEKNLIGFLYPQSIHNVIFTDGNGRVTGSISTDTRTYGRFGSISTSNSTIDLDVSGNQTAREKDNFRFGFLISKKTGKETGGMYQVFDDGQKVRIK